jgi:hypothetical protein
MYNLLYLAKGRFPWFTDGGQKPSAKTETIMQMKRDMPTEELFKGLPSNSNLNNVYF